MACAIERRQQIGQQQRGQRNQQQISGYAQMWRFWLMAVGAGKTASTTDISLIFPGFSSAFKAPSAQPPELTKPLPSTIVPAKSIGSPF